MKTLKDYFDKIYIINYIESADRREYINNQFKYYNLNNDYEFIFGLPFKKINALTSHIEEIAKYVPYGSGSISSMSCSLAHYTAIKSAYELGAKSVLILEDDVIFRDNIDMILDYLDNIPEDWDFINFIPGFNRNNINIQDLNLFLSSKSKWIDLKLFIAGNKHEINGFKPCGFTCTGAYALNKTAMEIYIQLFETNYIITNADMIEYFFNNLSQSPLKSYTPNKRLFAVKEELDTLSVENGEYVIKPSFSIASSPEISSENFKYATIYKTSSLIGKL